MAAWGTIDYLTWTATPISYGEAAGGTFAAVTSSIGSSAVKLRLGWPFRLPDQPSPARGVHVCGRWPGLGELLKGANVGDWLADTDVAPYVGAMADPGRLAEATAASKTFVEGRRSDLGLADLAAGEAPADVFLGAVLYAAIAYTARASSSGIPGYGDGAIDLGNVDQSLSYARAMRLIGSRRPVAL